MMDDDRKRQYRHLKSGMITVRSRTNEIIDAYNDLISSLKQGILIDDEFVYAEKIKENFEEVRNVKSEITNSILVSINNKI